MEAEVDSEAMEEFSLLTTSPGLLSLLYNRTQDHQHRHGTNYHELEPPTLITN